MTDGVRVGEVTHFYNKISVAAVRLSDDLKLGDVVHFLGRNTDFRQPVESMQVEHEDVTTCRAGDEVGIQVTRRVRPGDSVFKLVEGTAD